MIEHPRVNRAEARAETTPCVDVVIPVYNRTGFLGATIESVLAQTYRQWHLVIVDDGSTEDVCRFASGLADPRIRCIRQDNQGNAVARNTGIQQAAGEYVICLDSDDVWHPDMLSLCVGALQADPGADVAYTMHRYIDASGAPLPLPAGPAPLRGDLLEPLLLGHPILPSSALARRTCFERWGGYTPGLDDWELWLRWAAQGCRFACIEQPLLCYRIHDRNFNLDWARRRDAHFKMLDVFYQRTPLPPVALQLRERAYAEQHFRFAVLAWQVGRPGDGIAEFVQAAVGHPAYLADLDFYTQLACAHQGRIHAGTAEGLELAVAARTLEGALATLFSEPNLPAEVRQQYSRAHAWAYLALARLAYGVAQDMAAARRFLRLSLGSWPGVAWKTDWASWMVRSAIGRGTIQRVKAWSRGAWGVLCRR